MHRSQQWLQFSIAILIFAVASFAQKEHVPNRLGLSVVADQRRQAMSFSVSTLLTRNLHDVFGENDPARRRAAIDEIFTKDCVFYEPSGRVYHGRDETIASRAGSGPCTLTFDISQSPSPRNWAMPDGSNG